MTSTEPVQLWRKVGDEWQPVTLAEWLDESGMVAVPKGSWRLRSDFQVLPDAMPERP